MKRRHFGFLLGMVLLVLAVISTFGMIFLANASSDYKLAQSTLWNIEADETARSGIAYYQAHGVPPLVNGRPPKLSVFPQPDRTLEIAQVGNSLQLTGTLWNGTNIRAQVSYRVPLWDLHDLERAP